MLRPRCSNVSADWVCGSEGMSALAVETSNRRHLGRDEGRQMQRRSKRELIPIHLHRAIDAIVETGAAA